MKILMRIEQGGRGEHGGRNLTVGKAGIGDELAKEEASEKGGTSLGRSSSSASSLMYTSPLVSRHPSGSQNPQIHRYIYIYTFAAQP